MECSVQLLQERWGGWRERRVAGIEEGLGCFGQGRGIASSGSWEEGSWQDWMVFVQGCGPVPIARVPVRAAQCMPSMRSVGNKSSQYLSSEIVTALRTALGQSVRIRLFLRKANSWETKETQRI